VYIQIQNVSDEQFSEKTREDVQRKVNSLIRIGVILSIFWMAGVGSIISIVLGLKVKRIIKRSSGNITGIGGVYWCLIVGCLGLIMSLLTFIAIILPIFLKKY
jgi:hypothetical protein